MRAPICVLLAVAAWASPARAEAPLPKDSIYQLDVALTDQDGKTAELAARRGRVQVVAMFYSSCKLACPLITAAVQRAEQALTAAQRARLGVLFVSFDPARDTPEVLRRVADAHRMDLARWSLARTPAPSVRKLAAVLGVQYRVLADGEIGHANVITLLDADGRIVAQTTKLGAPDPAFIAALRGALE